MRKSWLPTRLAERMSVSVGLLFFRRLGPDFGCGEGASLFRSRLCGRPASRLNPGLGVVKSGEGRVDGWTGQDALSDTASTQS